MRALFFSWSSSSLVTDLAVSIIVPCIEAMSCLPSRMARFGMRDSNIVLTSVASSGVSVDIWVPGLVVISLLGLARLLTVLRVCSSGVVL